MKHKIIGSLLFVLALFSLGVLPLHAQPVFKTLHNFTATFGFFPPTNSDGAKPIAGLVLSGDTLYGTANSGGTNGVGTIFAVSADGMSFETLHSFGSYPGDGANPAAGLILSGDTLYGTTLSGGGSGEGTVFKINTDGTAYTNFYSFTAGQFDPLIEITTNSDGANPIGDLVLSGQTLYGTASNGGTNGFGTVFAINTNGTSFMNLHNFDGFSSNAGNPQAGLILSGNTLFGTTFEGTTQVLGAVFSINTDGTDFTNLVNGGVDSQASLILSGSTLYDASEGGDSGSIFAVNTDGTSFTNFYIFTPTAPDNFGNLTNDDGAIPEAGLILSGNTLYGTAFRGGNAGSGALFTVNADGSGFATLHSFTAFPNGTNSDGARPAASVILSDNALYGTAEFGGNAGNGTAFSLSLTAPSLAITPAGSQIVISWPASAANFELQTSTNLATGNWSNITNGITLAGDNFVLTNLVNGPAVFFRLQAQP